MTDGMNATEAGVRPKVFPCSAEYTHFTPLSTPLFFSSRPHDARKRADARLRNIRNAERQRILFVSRAHGRDEPRARRAGAQAKFYFGGDRVHRVHYVIVGGKVHGIRVFGQKEHIARNDFRFGRNILYPRFHCECFLLPQRGMKRDDLAVDIAFLHDVAVK